MEIQCKQCHTLFKTKKSLVEKGSGIFCSRSCYGKWRSVNERMWGINSPEFDKNRLKEVWKKMGESKKGKPSKLKGIKTGIIPKSAFKKGQNLREKHPNWKGGKWCWAKRFVLQRDNYKCQYCGLEEKDILDIAHKAGYAMKLRDRRYVVHNPDNLITLCPNCHRRYDLGKIHLKD
jgi:5-methylcytosine-specific restriction endonuclease McrA